MTPELLNLIRRWKARHEAEWPEGVVLDDWGVGLSWHPHHTPHTHERSALAIIEAAVMDALQQNKHREITVFWYDGNDLVVNVEDDRSGKQWEGVHSSNRLHALLLAVEELEATDGRS